MFGKNSKKMTTITTKKALTASLDCHTTHTSGVNALALHATSVDGHRTHVSRVLGDLTPAKQDTACGVTRGAVVKASARCSAVCTVFAVHGASSQWPVRCC